MDVEDEPLEEWEELGEMAAAENKAGVAADKVEEVLKVAEVMDQIEVEVGPPGEVAVLRSL